MKPFNLDDFKRGVPAITRDGREARFVAYRCADAIRARGNQEEAS